MWNYSSVLFFGVLLAIGNSQYWGTCDPPCRPGQICQAWPCQALPCLGVCVPNEKTPTTTTKAAATVPFTCAPACRAHQTCLGTNCLSQPCHGFCYPF
uniref:Secreted protein n=1 Tax=Steinernema glaseri TaxID=37863 RepID=A0A1I7Z5Y5_9BILA